MRINKVDRYKILNYQNIFTNLNFISILDSIHRGMTVFEQDFKSDFIIDLREATLLAY